MSDQLRFEVPGEQGLLHPEADTTGPVRLLSAPIIQPLVLDLDRTLIRTDLLFESLAAALHKNPFIIFLAFWWLLQGRAVLKRKLAEKARLDLDVIPVTTSVERLARTEAARGRIIVLATAADEMLARRIARRFPFISRVLASNGVQYLKGRTKADVLAQAFPQGFVYAGDNKSDLPVWAAASGIVLVPMHHGLERKARKLGKPVLVVEDRAMSLAVAMRGLRLKQWAKNTLVFAPVALAGQLGEAQAWLQAGLAFLALGLVASSTYLINDIFDLADDRRHWSKKNRPLAAGDMRIEFGLALVPCMAFAGFAFAAAAGPPVLATVLVYAALTLSYSLYLKRAPVLDVLTLASLFTLRLFLGVVAIGAVISSWLFIFSMALFLSLSVAKRHTEVVRMVLNGRSKAGGRGYVARDEPFLLLLGVGSALSAIVLFSVYLSAEAVRAAFYTAPQFLWLAPVVLFLWLGRVWLLSQRGQLDDDPVSFALKDRISLALGSMLVSGYGLAAAGGNLNWPL